MTVAEIDVVGQDEAPIVASNVRYKSSHGGLTTFRMPAHKHAPLRIRHRDGQILVEDLASGLSGAGATHLDALAALRQAQR